LKKLLLYRRGGLGDTLLTFPLLEVFKGQGFHITTVGNTDYFEIAKEVGWADRVLSEMPKEDFDKRIIIGTDTSGEKLPPYLRLSEKAIAYSVAIKVSK